MAEIKRLMDKAWSILEAQHWDRLNEVLSPDSEFRMAGQSLRGPHEFRAMCEAWWSAFPDLRHEVKSEIEVGDTYVCELVMVGTHTGTMRSAKGDIPATGKQIQMISCDYVKVNGGRVATWHAYPDMLGLLEQLGAA